MKVLACHNYYQQPGGEDQSFEGEVRLLESYGHEVVRYTRHNDDIRDMSRLSVAKRTIWNRTTTADLDRLIRREHPQIMHCTNTFPLISPSAYYTAQRHGVKVVQSLRNYRLLCPNAYFLRDGNVCQSCLGRVFAWPAVRYGCYRNDRSASTVVAGMLAVHRGMKTYHRAVDRFYALTEFSRRKFIEGGLPAERMSVKPNFLEPDPGAGDGRGGYALFVGRLSPEKGVDTLLTAWTQADVEIPLKIVGDGPEADRVQQASRDCENIEWLGRQPPERVLELVGRAKFLVMPSLWFEGFPRTILEAFAKGTPVIASNLGSMAELVEHNRTGALFETGDADDLSRQVRRLFSDECLLASMRLAAREEFESKYTAEINYRSLMEVYRLALGEMPVGDESYSVQTQAEQLAG